MKDVLLRSISVPRVSLGVVRLPLIGKRPCKSGGVIGSLMEHVIAWYDPKLQGCTNESLAEGMKLESLVEYEGLRHDMLFRNFTFGGLSGMGSYVTNFEAVDKRCEYEQLGEQHWKIRRLLNYEGNDAYKEPIVVMSSSFRGKGQTVTIRIKGMTIDKGIYVRTGVNAGTGAENNILLSNGDNIVTFTDLNESVYYVFHYKYDLTDVEIEILPLHKDALVFNGTAPEWVYDESNLKMNTALNAEWLSSNKIFIRKLNMQGAFFMPRQILYGSDTVKGNVGEALTISVPSFIIRIQGLSDKFGVAYGTQGYTGNMLTTQPITLGRMNKDGTYIIPAFTHTYEPSHEGIACYSSKLWIGIGKEGGLTTITPDDKLDFTIEFLPNYPAVTTTNYATIPTIPNNKVKCVMMDFVPLGKETEQWYYTQRNATYNKFAIMNYSVNEGITDISQIIAYELRNKLGTYIDGTLNTDKTVLDMLQQRQVVSVNNADPEYNRTILGYDSQLGNYAPQMALYSLILFDKELTEREMKEVMEKMMRGGEALLDSFNEDFNDDFN